MQHLLDFIYQHSVDSEVYLVAGGRSGDVELLWQRSLQPDHWQLRPHGCEGPPELVHRGQLLDALVARKADMCRVERELQMLCAAQIAFADMVLSAARKQLGRAVVQNAVREYRAFVGELQSTVEWLTQPSKGRELTTTTTTTTTSMLVIAGGGARTEARSGHLTVVNASTSE